MSHRNYVISLFVWIYCATAQGAVDTVTIELYQPERDWAVVRIILDESSETLACGSEGLAARASEAYLENPEYITKVLRVNDQTVGFINYKAYNWTFLTFHLKRCGLIHLLGVNKQHWRKGYGRKLLHHALADLKKRKVPWVELFVSRTNMGARVLYEKEGFSCVIPALLCRYFSILIYERHFPICRDELPEGNFVQRHSETVRVLIEGAGLAGLIYWAKSRLGHYLGSVT